MKKVESELAVPEILEEKLHTELAVVPVGVTLPDRLGDKGPDQIRKEVKRLRDNEEKNYWKLAEYLWHVYDKVLYQGWGFAAWKDYVEQEVDYQLRMAQELVHLWGIRRILPEAAGAVFDGIGSSNMRELMPVMTKDNWQEWTDKIRGLSHREVKKLVRGDVDKEEERLNGLPTGQAADEDEGKDAIQQKPVKLKDVNLLRPQLDTVERAIAKACDMAATESRGHAVTMIATEFLATNLGSNDPAAYLAGVERATGWRIVAVDPQTGKVLYGGALIEAAEQAGEATVLGSGSALPDPTADLAGCLAAIEAATGARVVAFDRKTPEVLFGEDTLAHIADE